MWCLPSCVAVLQVLARPDSFDVAVASPAFIAEKDITEFFD
jgi:hypothetical protein